jgi:glycosyltransferase involved in cell wall biosynthesis
MNIAMISYYLPSENKIGSGYQAHYMANALARRGHTVTMFSPVSRPDDALYALEQIPVGTSNRLYRFAANLARVDWSRFNVVHAHGEDYRIHTRGNPIHVRTMHGSCLAESLHVPGLKEKIRMLFLGITELLAFHAADATVGVSCNTTRSYPWIKRVILNGVDTSMFTPGVSDLKSEISNLKSPDPTLLFVGTYQNRKRGKLLMEIFARDILPKIPTAKMWMVCSDAPAAPNVEVLGRLSTPELADRFRRAWVFCLPSTYEGFGVPYIEAMASGTPVVASPNVGAKEVLANGKFGIVATDNDLGPAIANLLSSEFERTRYRELGLQRAKEFEWNYIMAQYEKLYEELMAKSSRPVTTTKPKAEVV